MSLQNINKGLSGINDTGGGGSVTSVFGRTGVVVAANGDYTASQVDYVPGGTIAATDVQGAIEELDAEKQPRDYFTVAATGADYTTLSAALKADKLRINIIGPATETEDPTIIHDNTTIEFQASGWDLGNNSLKIANDNLFNINLAGNGKCIHSPTISKDFVSGSLVGFLGDIANLSPIITNISINTNLLRVGQVIRNSNLASGTTLVTIDSATQITVSNNATNTVVQAPINSEGLTGNINNTSPIVTNTTTGSLSVGQRLTGPGFPLGTRVKTIDSGTQFTMTEDATATTVGVVFYFEYIAQNTTVIIDGFQVDQSGGTADYCKLFYGFTSVIISGVGRANLPDQTGYGIHVEDAFINFNNATIALICINGTANNSYDFYSSKGVLNTLILVGAFANGLGQYVISPISGGTIENFYFLDIAGATSLEIALGGGATIGGYGSFTGNSAINTTLLADGANVLNANFQGAFDMNNFGQVNLTNVDVGSLAMNYATTSNCKLVGCSWTNQLTVDGDDNAFIDYDAILAPIDNGIGNLFLGRNSPATTPVLAGISPLGLAYGGLETDTSAFVGVPFISGGATSELKYNLIAVVAPTVNDDSADGYVVGSRWINLATDIEYVATDVTVGAAVWKPGAGSAGTTNLAYVASATDGTVTSDTGTDATIPAGSTTNASLMLPADKTKLNGVETGAQNNTVSNQGVGGVGLFDAKVASDLQFRNINAGSNKITVTLDAPNKEVDLDVVEANLTLNNIGGTLGISKGGTGQTTQTTAFDALAPTTTQGDLILRNASNNVRLGIGANNTILTSNGTTASWAAPATQAGTTNLTYTASPTNGIVNSDTGTDATITLADTTNAGLLAPADKTKLNNTSGTNTGDQTITLTGDVTGTGTGSFAATIAADAVTNAKLANMSTQTIKGRTTAGTGDPEDLTGAQALAVVGGVAKAGDTMTGALNWATTVSIASASTVNIGAAASNEIIITGTTTITAFDTIAAGAVREVLFSGALTLTHNATSLILPGGANITTAANDTVAFRSLGSGNWVCLYYKRQTGAPIAAAGSNTQVQFNNSGVFGGASDLTYTSSSGITSVRDTNPRITVTTSRALALTDSGAFLYNATAGVTLTVPTNASVAFPNDSQIRLIYDTSSSDYMIILGDTGVTVNGVSAGTFYVRPTNGQCVLRKINTNTWQINNDAEQGTWAPKVSVTGTTQTLNFTHAQTLVTTTNAAAVTLTVPTNATTAFPIKTEIAVLQGGAGQVTFAAAGGVTINNTNLKITEIYKTAVLIKTGTNTWDLTGSLTT